MTGRPLSLLLAHHGTVLNGVELAREAAAAGVTRVWSTETDGPDALLASALIAASVPVEVGTAIVPVSTRSAPVLAMAAADLTHVSGRPVHLGIGAGGRRIVESWHGLAYDGMADRIAETIAVLRQALSGGRTSFRGVHVRSEGFRLAVPPSAPVHLYVGGMGPRLTSTAAAVADGLILSWTSAEEVRRRRRELDELVIRAGRSAGSVRLLARAYVAVTDDPAAVRAAVRDELIGYLVSPPYAAAFRRQGFAAEVAAVGEAFGRGDRPAAAAGVSDRMLDAMVVAGDEVECARRVDELVACGADEVLVQLVPTALGGDPVRTVRSVAS